MIIADHLFPAPAAVDETAYAGPLSWRLNKIANPSPIDDPARAIYGFCHEAIYHDDAWANWSADFAVAMFGYAAGNGTLAYFEGTTGDLPTLYLKDGDDLVIINLDPNRLAVWPRWEKKVFLDKDMPISVTHYRINIAKEAQAALNREYDDYH